MWSARSKRKFFVAAAAPVGCMAWPFFSKDEKVSWLEECCTEFNVLNGSSRERMRDSVLTPEQVQTLSKFDTKAKTDTDVGGSCIGQDPALLWTQKGLSKFKGQLKKLKKKLKKGDLVDSDFLEKNQAERDSEALVELAEDS